VFKVIIRFSTVLTFLVFALSYGVRAQISPTNTATISGSVSDVAGKSVADAKVSLSGPKSASTQTDAYGLFVFVGVPFGTYQISAAVQNLGTVTRSVTVEGDTNVAIQYEPASLNGMKVIANVSTSANANFNITPASVTQLSPMQNAFEGKTSWRTILEQIPGVVQAGLGNGATSSNGGTTFDALPDGNLEAKQISINGALPYETAILFDDMPLIGGSYTTTAGAGTNIGLYPLNGFSSADVVRGPGANAPSIVDSIGGSFVLHASGPVTQNQYELSLSTDPYGGIVANTFAAVRWHKLSVVLTYGVNDSPGPTNQGVIPAYTLFNPSTVNGTAFSPYSPSCTLPTCQDGTYLLNPNYATGSFATYGQLESLLVCCSQVSTVWSQHSGSLGLSYAFSPSVSASVTYIGQITNQGPTYPDLTDSFAPPPGYTGNIPAGQIVLPETGYLLGLGSDTVQQTSSLIEEKITAQLGKGVLRVAALQNRTFSSVDVTPSRMLTMHLYGGGYLCSNSSVNCSSGTYSLTAFNGGTYAVGFPQVSEFSNFDSNNRDLLFSYATPLGENIHAGVSFVQSYYNFPQSIYCIYLGTVFPPFATPSAVSQTTNEFRIFVGGTPSEKTSLDLSMYFANADYHVQNPKDPSGNTYVDPRFSYAAPRLGFVWRPTAAVAVRASAGGGFAEAPLQDLAGQYGFAANGTPFCSGGVCSATLTNLNLQPEKSFAFDLGTDIRLRRNTVLSFDVYRSNLYGQFYNSTTPSGLYHGLPLLITQYGNLGESRYEGVLLDVRHDTPRGIYWSLSGGLTRGYVISVPKGFYNGFIYPSPSFTPVSCTNCVNLTVVPGVNFNGTFAAAIPYSQALGTFGYRWSTEKFIDLVSTYYGNGNTYFRPAFVEIDAHVSYPLTKNGSLLVTLRNITGIYDRPIVLFSPANMSGAPTVSGLSYPLYGEEYGPRTIILTTNMRL